jgi:hypothetical protein
MRLVSVEFKLGYIKFYYIIFHHNYFIIYLLHLVLISFSIFFIFQVFFHNLFFPSGLHRRKGSNKKSIKTNSKKINIK